MVSKMRACLALHFRRSLLTKRKSSGFLPSFLTWTKLHYMPHMTTKQRPPPPEHQRSIEESRSSGSSACSLSNVWSPTPEPNFCEERQSWFVVIPGRLSGSAPLGGLVFL